LDPIWDGFDLVDSLDTPDGELRIPDSKSPSPLLTDMSCLREDLSELGSELLELPGRIRKLLSLDTGVGRG